MVTKETLIDRLPRYATGRLKSPEEAGRIIRLLGCYRYTEKEMGMFEAEVGHLIEKHGHAGVFIRKKNRREPDTSRTYGSAVIPLAPPA